uniref:Uncharacterized protein n=1 Tax=Rhizophora mucronata TaxID=61149 RepID=A0A2P2PZX2_RHIMU
MKYKFKRILQNIQRVVSNQAIKIRKTVKSMIPWYRSR